MSMGGRVYGRNAFEKQLDSAVAPVPAPSAAELAAKRAAARAAAAERERLAMIALRARVANQPQKPDGYGLWSREQMESFLSFRLSEPQDPRVKS
jgi:hypothetical protein